MGSASWPGGRGLCPPSAASGAAYSQIADCIYDTVKPFGVAVVIQAEHMCMTMRGVSPGALTVTSAVRGLFETRAQTRNELLSDIE